MADDNFIHENIIIFMTHIQYAECKLDKTQHAHATCS